MQTSQCAHASRTSTFDRKSAVASNASATSFASTFSVCFSFFCTGFLFVCVATASSGCLTISISTSISFLAGGDFLRRGGGGLSSSSMSAIEYARSAARTAPIAAKMVVRLDPCPS